ncbi:type II secretion system F family protein [Caulobacter sp. Root1472]|uniref:type II secretion system F family protein n=1 Tax=Caulobacter sp. Root1472 TaxID=1736470 RepID=UPI000AAD5691|nr:type II secretion system F family protein [Caulobacter sp. Root1472]
MNAALSAMRNKTDKHDARGIAQILRSGWYSRVHVKSIESHHLRALISCRKVMQRKCIDLENEIRGLLKIFGVKLPLRLSRGAFDIAVRDTIQSDPALSHALLPMLAIRRVRSDLARSRLQVVLQQVRLGVSLSQALQEVKGFPSTIVRLVSVGESTGALGRMLQRSGKLEEDAAVCGIEAAARLMGPALIVLLGGLIGLMMAGLLSGVTELGQAALN